MSDLTIPDFVGRWQNCALSERSAAQSHFIDVCDVLAEPRPAEVDQEGNTYTFEKGVTKTSGEHGFADVWMRGYFAWEYKGKHKDLDAAYLQLLQYREDLENPPLLVVCDLDRFEVHTNFTNTLKQVYEFTLADLVPNQPTATCKLPPLEVLRAVFADPERLKPGQTTAQVTEAAAAQFSRLSDSLRSRGVPSERAAHFLMRLLFCLFSEDIGLLPEHLFSRLVESNRHRPAEFTKKLRQLFSAMAGEHGAFGEHDIAYFDGGLFSDDEAYDLTTDDLAVLTLATALDWSSIEPAIFGTLFERSLDPDKRSQLGAHYTSEDDIRLIVEPVLMKPLRRRWNEVREKAADIVEKAKGQQKSGQTKSRKALSELLKGFAAELAAVRVLDPACGSGNFLYVSLKRLLDLEKEISVFAANNGLSGLLPLTNPAQLYGIETNVYAHELASVVVWIGYIQWQYDNGFIIGSHPILRPLQNIRHMDSVLGYSDLGVPLEPEWPDADVIIGNPPFLGGKKLRTELGDKHVDDLFDVYEGSVPHEADFVCYWFEKARQLIADHRVKRAGLLATQGIRGGANRKVLERIKESGDIFWAYSDRNWILDGATVHVSMVGFDDGTQTERTLDDKSVPTINCGIRRRASIIPDAAVERLVWCSAGVPRDFLWLFLTAMQHALQNRRSRIGVQEVNLAVGEFGQSKMNELAEDTTQDSDSLRRLLDNLQHECLDELRSNSFLARYMPRSTGYDMLQKLMDLRLVHLLHPSITPGKAGQRYEAYLLDYSFYTGVRRRHGLKELHISSEAPPRYTELRVLPKIDIEALLAE